MHWMCYQLTYELLSPLHIGYHKVGNLQRTRYYLPARNLWGAVTESLTRRGFATSEAAQGDYRQIGEWVQKHSAFTYFFVVEGDNLLIPEYAKDGLKYGRYSQTKFERCYLDSQITTALTPYSTSAAERSLHEVEFITPRTHLRGWVFLDEEARSHFDSEAQWRQWLGRLQVGGERRYGFGQLRLAENGWERNPTLPEGYQFLNNLRPHLKIESQKPLLAHTLVSDTFAQGLLEPLLGRTTLAPRPGMGAPRSDRFGHYLTSAKICWAPGSLLQGAHTFQIEETGVWQKV